MNILERLFGKKSDVRVKYYIQNPDSYVVLKCEKCLYWGTHVVDLDDPHRVNERMVFAYNTLQHKHSIAHHSCLETREKKCLAVTNAHHIAKILGMETPDE